MKPMLATDMSDLSKLRFPGYASPKLDGVRCLVRDGVALTRALKPIPNRHVQALLGRPEYHGFDGELLLDREDFNAVQSAVMSAACTPPVNYHVFDLTSMPDAPFEQRYDALMTRYQDLAHPFGHIRLVPQYYVTSLDGLLAAHDAFTRAKFEGTMFRSPSSPYKHGRSTEKEQFLVKVKNWHDDEATVVGFEPLMRNDNVPALNELGFQKRSSHKANLVATEQVGALQCLHRNGQPFNIGSGFTSAQRTEMWGRRSSLIGAYVKFKYLELTPYGVPRSPIFVGFRDARDM